MCYFPVLAFLKLTVNATSCLACLNNKKEKCFVCTPLELSAWNSLVAHGGL